MSGQPFDSRELLSGLVADSVHRFDEHRFENPTPDMKAAFSTFMLGSRSCLGRQLAMMEMRLAIALFFRECKGMRLGQGTTDESMEQVMRIFITPRGKKCDITLVDELAQ